MHPPFPLSVLFACIALLASVSAQGPVPQPPLPDPSLVPVEDVPELPRVLIIGDSISMGYTLPVRAQLRGRANVHRIAENAADSGNGLRKLDKWLGGGRWDVILFNFGLHDLKYLDAAGRYVPPDQGKQLTSLPQYEANLRDLAVRLRTTGAELIYATTTPVPADSLARVEHDERAYNDVACRVMRELAVPVVDLATLVGTESKLQLPKNVHFTEAGYEELGRGVAVRIAQALRCRRRP